MNIYDELSRKQITFDLHQKSLEKYYPQPEFGVNPFFYKKAYSDISDFMEANGFEHRQYSVYTSKEPMSVYGVNKLTEKLASEMPWLNNCVNEIDVTDIKEQHSLKQILEDVTKPLNPNLEVNLTAFSIMLRERFPSIKSPIEIYRWKGVLFNHAYGLTGDSSY
jgi:virulence-associated protein VapD